MSQMTKTSLLVLLSAGLLVVAGCGDKNSQATFNSVNGAHLAGWVPTGHRQAATADLESCTECHGEDFSGGVSKVACTSCHLGDETHAHPLEWGNNIVFMHASSSVSSTAGHTDSCKVCHGSDLTGSGTAPSCTSCHIGGAESFHPQDWGTQTYIKHASYVDVNGNTSCANAACHGTDLAGVAQSGPSCTSCHLGGVSSVHPAGWNTTADFNSGQLPLHAQYVASHGSPACANAVCHGTNLQGVFGSGPSCNTCHSF